MWPKDRNFGSLYRGIRYNGARYIGVLTIQITVMLPGPKKYFVITGTSLYRSSLLYISGLVISGFLPIQITVMLPGQKQLGTSSNENGNVNDDDSKK